MLYRLGEKGLYLNLKERGVFCTIVQSGRNDIRLARSRSLTAKAIDQYAVVLEALHRLAPVMEILLDGVCGPADEVEDLEDPSNVSLRLLVEDFDEVVGATKG